VLEVRHAGLPVIATGGIGNGLDAAKALALGASFVGVGRYAITAAVQGPDALADALGELIDELRLALVLCGARTVAELQATPPVLTGPTLEWARQRNVLP
jgi:isopentenyl-diphosphate delta-isomerase